MSWSLLIFVLIGQLLALWRTKHLKGGATRGPSQLKISQTFLYMFWDISLKLGIYIKLVVSHVKFEFHSNLDSLTYFTAKNRSKSFICIHGLKTYIEAPDLVHTQIVSLPLLIFVMLGQYFWPSGGQKHSKGEVSRAPSQRHMRFEFHQNQVSTSEKFSGLFSKCFAVSTWKLVYTLSMLHNILSSCFTRVGSLWPSSCS